MTPPRLRDAPRGQRAPFGIRRDGTMVERLTIGSDPRAPGRISLGILTLGATLHGLWLDDDPLSISPGGADLAAQDGPLSSFGSLTGPVVNRVRGGRVQIDGESWQMPCVPGGGWSQHSGPEGIQARIWQVADLAPDRAVLRLLLPHGACGLPGDRVFEVTYHATPGALLCTVSVATDRRTPINIAHHAYWNLNGGGSLAGHRLQLAASRMLETDAQILPTGRLLSVAGGPLDYRGMRVLSPGPDNRHDHCLVLDEPAGQVVDGMRLAAILEGPDGTRMRLETDAPALQVYDGGTVDSAGMAGLNGGPIAPYEALALEAQGYPDAPNRPEFPTIMLDPGRTWRRRTRWSFERPEARG